jgi:hypothetical protein
VGRRIRRVQKPQAPAKLATIMAKNGIEVIIFPQGTWKELEVNIFKMVSTPFAKFGDFQP